MLRLLTFVALALLARPVQAQASGVAPEAGEEVPPPWGLQDARDGDGPLSVYTRMLAAGETYMASAEWRDAYLQILAQKQAALGEHMASLTTWDLSRVPRPDSVGVLASGVYAVDAAEYIARRAEDERIVMVNEAHHDAATRLLTLRLLPLLYARGYRYLAAETFAPGIADSVAARGYAASGDGYVSDEPVFGEMIREALRLGYTLVPYEIEDEEIEGDTLNRQQRRDFAQAQHLAERVFSRDPDAKVLVHAGFGHVEEIVGEYFSPMAVYFRDLTGIDPLTVDQVVMTAKSDVAYAHPRRRAAVAAGFTGQAPTILLDASGQPLAPERYHVDLQTLTPSLGHPAAALPTRRVETVTAPEACARVLCLVEVRASGEGEDAISLDRFIVGAPGPVAVSARGQARVRILDGQTGALLFEQTLSDD